MFSLVLLILVATPVLSIPNPTHEKKSHVLDKKLSDLRHEEDGDHNPEYDHEAFLGKEDARTFDTLKPEESRRRLGLIYEKIDKNSDGLVTMDELKQWIKYVQNHYSVNDAREQFKQLDIDEKSGRMNYAQYLEHTYGTEGNELEQEDNQEEINRDKKRWVAADKDSLNTLNFEQFRSFLHPEDSDHMHNVVIQETLDDIDTDKDEKISLKEYLADMNDGEDSEDNMSPDGDTEEEKDFNEQYDKNKDGFLTDDEIKNWIIPNDYDHVDEEAEHLFSEADVDKNGGLTKDEVVSKYDLFVGSQATDYGDAIERHDEF